jgi:hypothetical protein
MSNNMTLFPLLPLQNSDSNLKKQPCFTVLLVILVLLTQRHFWSKPHQMKWSSLPPQQVKTAVTEEERTTTTVVDGTPNEVVKTGLTTSVVVGADNNSNNGSNGAALGNIGLSGTFHHVLTHHPTIGVGRTTTIPTLSKVEFLDLYLNKLLSMSTHLAQLTLKMPFALSTLRSRTHLGRLTPEPLPT